MKTIINYINEVKFGANKKVDNNNYYTLYRVPENGYVYALVETPNELKTLFNYYNALNEDDLLKIINNTNKTYENCILLVRPNNRCSMSYIALETNKFTIEHIIELRKLKKIKDNFDPKNFNTNYWARNMWKI